MIESLLLLAAGVLATTATCVTVHVSRKEYKEAYKRI